MQRLFSLAGLMGLAWILVGCTEPPYTNVDNAQLRALLAQDRQGYRHIYNVRDGITRWIAEGGPVVRP